MAFLRLLKEFHTDSLPKPFSVLLTAFLSGLCLLPLCGCGRTIQDKTADGRIILQYWEKWTGFEDDAMQVVVDDYNRSQNRVFVKKLTISEMSRKIMLATAGGNPPDIADIYSSTVPDFSEKGALTPLDRMIERTGIKADDYIPIYWKECCHHGFVWALPSTPSSLALHWNKKLFRDAGLDPERPPQTLAELDAIADRLTIVDIQRDGKTVRVRFTELTDAERQAKRFKLVQVGHLPQEPGWWINMWGFWFAADFWDGDRRITANSPENTEAFQWLRSYPEKLGVDNMRAFSASFGNFASPQSPFLAGKVAMELQGVWMYNFINKYTPQMEWGAAPFPANDPQHLPLVTLAACDAFVIPRGARHPQEAFEFMRYLNTQGPMEKVCMGQRKFSPLVKVSAEFMRNHPNPYIKTFIELAKSPNAHYEPHLSIWNEYNDELQAAVDRVMALQASPQEALAEVQQRMQLKFDRVCYRWDIVKDARIKKWSQYDAR